MKIRKCFLWFLGKTRKISKTLFILLAMLLLSDCFLRVVFRLPVEVRSSFVSSLFTKKFFFKTDSQSAYLEVQNLKLVSKSSCDQ